MMTYNEIKRLLPPWQIESHEEDEERRHFYIQAPLIICWQYFGAGSAPSFLTVSRPGGEEGRQCFFNFHLPSSSCTIISIRVIPPLWTFSLSFFLLSHSSIDPLQSCPRLPVLLPALQIILQIEKKTFITF